MFPLQVSELAWNMPARMLGTYIHSNIGNHPLFHWYLHTMFAIHWISLNPVAPPSRSFIFIVGFRWIVVIWSTHRSEAPIGTGNRYQWLNAARGTSPPRVHSSSHLQEHIYSHFGLPQTQKTHRRRCLLCPETSRTNLQPFEDSGWLELTGLPPRATETFLPADIPIPVNRSITRELRFKGRSPSARRNREHWAFDIISISIIHINT